MKKSSFKLLKRAVRSAEICAVPFCSSSAKYFTVSFHCFPADPELRAKWEVNIRRDNFTATNRSRVCSKHFLPEDKSESKKGLRRRLRKGALPVLFEWNGYQVRQLAGGSDRKERQVLQNCTNQMDNDMNDVDGMEVFRDHDYCKPAVPEPAAEDSSSSTGDEIEEEILKLKKQLKDMT